MKTKSKIAKLRKWMVANYGQEVYNKWKVYVLGEYKTINCAFEGLDKKDLIGSLFTWADTLEGTFFWSDLNKAWLKHLEGKDNV